MGNKNSSATPRPLGNKNSSATPQRFDETQEEKIYQLVKTMLGRLSHEPDPAKRAELVRIDLSNEPVWVRDRVIDEVNLEIRILHVQMNMELTKQEAMIAAL
ncbi:MAG: hypothetical protein WC700_04205 [Gemmatimonadaceae bacterium]|jgi:hypothetical protein